MAKFNETTEVESKTEAKTVVAGKVHADLRAILVKPRISEKAGKLASLGKYVFNVARQANKISVKRAVEQQYQVKVIQVNILNTEGKSRTYGRTSGKMSDFKKAVVTLKEGQKIE